MKRLKGYSKKVTLAILFFVTGVFLTSFDSFASSDFDFIYNSAQPTCGEGQGYLVLLMHNGNAFNTRLYSFMSSAVNSNGVYTPASSQINITSDYVEFNIHTNNSAVSGFHAVYYIAQSGNMTLIGASDSNKIGFTPTGGEIIGWQVYGNGYVSSNTQNTSQYWSVNFRGGDAMNVYALEIVDALNDFIVSNGENTEAINSKLESLEQYLNDILNESTSSKNFLSSIYNGTIEILDYTTLIFSNVEWGFQMIEEKMTDIYDCLDRIEMQLVDVNAKLDETNSWLYDIWDSIQNFFNPRDEDIETTDKFTEDNNAQSDKLNDLNEQNKVDKVDPGNASGSVDAYIDENAILNYGVMIQIFTNHEYILKCIMVVLAVGLVSYVLFGKKR